VPSSTIFAGRDLGCPLVGNGNGECKKFSHLFVLANHGDIGMALGLYKNFKFKTQLVIIFKPEFFFANGMFGW
jgi:hypothetical protein